MYSIYSTSNNAICNTPRPEFLGVLVWKEAADTTVGMAVRKAEDGSLRISQVNQEQGDLLQHAPFEFADKLHCINQVSCAYLTAQEAMNIVRAATGWLTIVVQNCGGSPHLLSVTVCCSQSGDSHHYSRAGLSLQQGVKALHPQQQDTHMSLCISGLHSFGLFVLPSLLEVGDEVISINGIDCQRARLDGKAALLQMEHHFATDKYCTLVVVRGLSLPPPPLSAHFHEPLVQPAWMEVILPAGNSDDIKTPVGISFHHDLKVSDIDPCGRLARGPFRFGDKLICINNKNQDMSVEQVMKVLHQEEEMDAPLSIVMQRVGGDANIVATKVYKPQRSRNMNITIADMALERKDNWGSLRIARLDNDSGLFAATALLAVGDEVLFFNTVNCAGLDAQVITRAIQEEPDSVSIVAKKKRLQWSGPHLVGGAVVESPQQPPQFESPEMVPLEKDRPEFLEVVVWKDQPDIMVGVSLKRMGDDQALRVSQLNPNGLLGETPLRFGDTFRKINNESCEGMKVLEAIELLRNATGRLAIVVENIGGNPELLSTTVSRQPEAWRSKEVGISLRQQRGGPLCIHGLQQSGLFAETLLRVGDQVRLINDFDCRGLDCRSATRMMNEDTEFVTIVAARKQVAVLNPQARPEFVESILWKANADVTVGVTFTTDDDDGRTLRIASLDPCGLLLDSPFCVNDTLFRINNSSVEYMSEEQAEALVREATGTLSLVVQNESGDSSLVTSMVQKPTAESSPGISLESSGSDKTLCISGFYAYGLFGQSLLNVGDQVLSINNVECTNLDVETAMKRSDFAHARSLTIAVKRHQGPVHVEVDPILDILDDVSYAATVVAEMEIQKTSAGAAQDFTEAVVEPERHHAAAVGMASYAMAPTVQAVPTSSMIPDDATIFALDGTRMDPNQNFATQKADGYGSDRPEFLGGTIWKDEGDVFALGIWVAEAEDETLRISALDPSGPFGKSQFQFSDKLHSIQNRSCEGMTAQEAIDIMQLTTGWLSIVVHNASGDPSTVAVMVTKRTPDEPAGISLKTHGNSVQISGLTPSGLLAHSLLNIGDQILFVNGVDCRKRSALQLAIKTIREAPSCVSIVAKAQYGAGIVLSVQDYSNPAEHETADVDANHETDPEQIEGDGTVTALADPASATQGCCIIL